jgi:hypothetical protein
MLAKTMVHPRLRFRVDMEDFLMSRLPVLSLALLLTGTVSLAQAEMPERPLPPAPAEQMGAPADCDPTMRSSDPNAAVNRDCPTAPKPYRDGTQNRARGETGKPPTLDPESGGRELDPR